MDIYDLSVKQLKRAAVIKEQMVRLNKELGAILGVPDKIQAATKKVRKMSATVKKKIAATQRARWASLRRVKPAARKAKAAVKVIKKKVSRATRSKLSAKLKAYWAAKKAGKK
jgi:hypothetical protein